MLNPKFVYFSLMLCHLGGFCHGDDDTDQSYQDDRTEVSHQNGKHSTNIYSHENHKLHFCKQSYQLRASMPICL